MWNVFFINNFFFLYISNLKFVIFAKMQCKKMYKTKWVVWCCYFCVYKLLGFGWKESREEELNRWLEIITRKTLERKTKMFKMGQIVINHLKNWLENILWNFRFVRDRFYIWPTIYYNPSAIIINLSRNVYQNNILITFFFLFQL